jgi:pimeloyl-ACP methyl ester carboxylesterase
MNRWIKRGFVVLVSVLTSTMIFGWLYQWNATRKDLHATPAPGRMVDVGGYKLHILCEGAGAPAVVLDTGLGGSMVDWGYVQPQVAEFTRVCSYDRAGMGYSDPSPSARTSRQISRELSRLIQNSGIDSPIVLVGASLGGLYVRAFAYEDPASVAGLVLVDASHEDQEARYTAVNANEPTPWFFKFVPFAASIGALRIIGFAPGMEPDSLPAGVRNYARAVRFRTSAYRAAVDELLHFDESAAEVRELRHTLPVPVTVLSAGASEESQARVQVWNDLQRSQVSLSSRGCQIIARKSRHVIQIEEPDIVVDAIRRLVDESRTGIPQSCEFSAAAQ